MNGCTTPNAIQAGPMPQGQDSLSAGLVQILMPFQRKWHKGKFYPAGHGNNAYLRFTVMGKAVSIYAGRQEMIAMLRDALDYFENHVADLPGPRPAPETVTAITPSQVIAYFRQSPVLAPIADDVEAALSPLIDAYDDQAGDLARVKRAGIELLDDQGQPVYGAQSRIGEVLGIPNAGAHRTRILSVLEQLQRESTSTTAQNGSDSVEVAA